MVNRVVLGVRNNGDVGVFVSPAGVDADTAADSALLLNVVSKVSQLILLGSIASNGTVVLGLGSKPMVFVTSQWNFSGVTGHTLGSGPMRPSPMIGSSKASAQINSGGASMDIVAPTKTTYAVYSEAF